MKLRCGVQHALVTKADAQDIQNRWFGAFFMTQYHFITLHWIAIAPLMYMTSCQTSQPGKQNDHPSSPSSSDAYDPNIIRRVMKPYSLLIRSIARADGVVDWKRLQSADNRRLLQEVVTHLADIEIDGDARAFREPRCRMLNVYTEPSRAAFVVNAYNALGLEWMLAEGVPDDIPATRRGEWMIGGRPWTFEHIERMCDPEMRIFLLSTYAKGSPRIAPEAYSGATMRQQVARQEKLYVHNPNAVKVTKFEMWLNDRFLENADEFVSQRTALRVTGMPEDRVVLERHLVRIIGTLLGEEPSIWQVQEIKRLGFNRSLSGGD